MGKLHLGFFASHGGSNMQAIIDNIKKGKLDAIPSVLISNNSNSGAIQRAINENIPYYHISSKTHQNEEDYIQTIIDVLDKHNVDTLVLAGYMKILDKRIISHFNGRALNIHPALLPKYGGKDMYGIKVHQAVIAAKEKQSGVTVHLINENYDDGCILAQSIVEVCAEDTVEILAARVLEQEHIIYSETLQKIALNEIKI